MQRVSRVAVSLVGLLAAAGLVAGCGKAGSSGTQAPASNAASGGCAPVAGDKLVVLTDDKHLQNADNVVPIGRSKVFTSEVTTLLDKVSAKLTTDALIQMNKSSDVDKEDPGQIATDWLKKNGFST